MKKYLPYIIVVLVICAIIFVLANKSDDLTPTNNINSKFKYYSKIIDKGDTIPEEICDEIKNQVIIIWKTGCPGCAIAVPTLQEIEKEQNLNFNYINVAEEQDRERLLEIGIVPRWVPTLIVDCEIYTGALKKEEYKQILDKK